MSDEVERRPELRDLEEALGRDAGALRAFLSEVHPADLAQWLEEVDEDEFPRIYASLAGEGRSQLLSFAEDPVREELLKSLNVAEIVDVVEQLPADEVVDLLALTDDATSEQVLRSVDFERAQGLRELASYDAETAGGLMTTEFVAVSKDVHVGDAIKEIKYEESPGNEEELGVFVLDEEGRPIGFVSDRELLTTPIHTPIEDVMDTDLVTVTADEDQEEAAQIVRKYSLPALAVVDPNGVLIGVVSAEDAQDVLQEEAEEDILRIVGTSPEEGQTHLPVLVRVRHRLPLQGLTVLGGLVTAQILDYALPTTNHDTASILRYLPIIIGLAGNVGIQSSTILVRAFATGELSREREASVLGSELFVGLLIGLLCGLATMVVASQLEPDSGGWIFGVALGVAIAVSVTWAAFLGCIVPIFCQRNGIDPAIVAGPFLITLSDISGAGIFVGVATVALNFGTAA